MAWWALPIALTVLTVYDLTGLATASLFGVQAWPGGDEVLDLQPFYLFNFIEGSVVLVLPIIGLVFGWLPPTLRWAAQRRRAIEARTHP